MRKIEYLSVPLTYSLIFPYQLVHHKLTYIVVALTVAPITVCNLLTRLYREFMLTTVRNVGLIQSTRWG